MGFFSGVRRRIKKIIPKEVRPFIPFIAAAIPGMAALGPIASPFTKAALAKIATDDEADIKDALRTGALAAAPAALSKGVTSLAGGDNALATFLNKSRAVEGGNTTIARGIEKALNPETFMGKTKLIGSQAATDFGIKQAELNKEALEQYNADLLAQGIRDKTKRRSAIFSIFTGAGYDEDETNAMLDKYGYADGGRVNYKEGATEELQIKINMMRDAGMSEKDIVDFLKGKADDFEEEEKFSASEFSDNLTSGISGLEKAFGQPLGGRRPEPMRIIPGLVGYIDSTDVAFDGREMGVFMVLMAILGGKGTLWGPVIGATVFHIFKEGFWTFFLGWQYVALGVLIVVIVIYFPEGIMGWLREKYPERFGEVVDEADRKAQVELK